MSQQFSQDTNQRPFGHLADPLFLVCLIIWVTGRGLKEFNLSPDLVRSYLNDLICVPFWVPVITHFLSVTGFRSHTDRPKAWELVMTLFAFSVVFEFVFPVLPAFRGLAVSDPHDIICYCLGALVANEFWHHRYRRGFCEANTHPKVVFPDRCPSCQMTGTTLMVTGDRQLGE